MCFRGVCKHKLYLRKDLKQKRKKDLRPSENVHINLLTHCYIQLSNSPCKYSMHSRAAHMR